MCSRSPEWRLCAAGVVSAIGLSVCVLMGWMLRGSVAMADDQPGVAGTGPQGASAGFASQGLRSSRACERPVLRVAADPNNLPFSNDKLEGLDNKIARLIADDLGMELAYVWHAQRRGFVRETIKAGEADLILGVPKGMDMVETTEPYYRSTYVFLSRADRSLRIDWFDDPALRSLTIGVQMIGNDGVNTPPAHALARRGVIDNVRGYTLYGDYRDPNPPARIVEAVAKGDVDVAVVWGPLAGYFADKQAVPMSVVPVARESDANGLKFAFGIAAGVKKGNTALRDKVNGVLERRRAEVERIVNDFHVPRTEVAAGKEAAEAAGSGLH